jgi:senataxin/terminal uridylyltransferase
MTTTEDVAASADAKDDDEAAPVTPSTPTTDEKKEGDDALDEAAAAHVKTPNQTKKTKSKAAAFVTPDWAASLERVPDLASLLHAAMKDISAVRMRDPSHKRMKTKRGRHNPNASRLVAMDAQRERLQKLQLQQQQQTSSANESAVDPTDELVENLVDVTLEDTPDLPDEEENDDEEDEEEDQDGHRSPREAWMLLVRALNSLVLLAPPLSRLLGHAQRESKQLSIGGRQIVNRRQSSAWLLGTHVFDVTTRRDLVVLQDSLQRLLYVNGLGTAVFRKANFAWDASAADAHFDPLLAFLVQGYQTEVTSRDSDCRRPAWVQRHPLSWLRPPDKDATHEASLAQLEACTTRLDETLGLLESPQEATAGNLLRRAVRELEDRLTFLFRKRFPKDQVRLRVYGSNLSGLSAGKSSDVDISLELKQASRLLEEFDSGHITAAAFDKRRKQLVYQVCRCLEGRQEEFFDMQPIARARVPVIKGKWLPNEHTLPQTAKLDFDICFFNGIAYANSSLLKEYTLVDARVKPLIRLVKRWAKDRAIGSAATGTWSSYAWTNMTIFYLQAVGLVPNLQNPDLMKRLGVTRDANNPDHTIKNLDTFFLTWEQAKAACPPVPEMENLSITALFYGFLRFYVSDFPSSILLVSIRRGPEGPYWPRCVFRKPKTVWSIEDPFETFDAHCPHDLNHADDRGIVSILHSFRETKSHLEAILLSDLGDGKMPVSLWPETVAAPAPAPGSSKKKRPPRGKKKPHPKEGATETKANGGQNVDKLQPVPSAKNNGTVPGKLSPTESSPNQPEHWNNKAKKGRRGGPSKESEQVTGDSPAPNDKHHTESRGGRGRNRGSGRRREGRGRHRGGGGGTKADAGVSGSQVPE